MHYTVKGRGLISRMLECKESSISWPTIGPLRFSRSRSFNLVRVDSDRPRESLVFAPLIPTLASQKTIPGK